MRLGLNRHIKIRIFPAHSAPMWQNVNKILVLCLVVTTFAMGFTYYYAHMNPLIINLSRQHSSQLITSIINDTINEYMEKNALSYEDLTSVERSDSGQIQALFMNTKALNQTKAQLSAQLTEQIRKVNQTKIEIPLGAVLDIPLMSGIGPMLDVELIPIGYALVDFENSFSSAGINQTKHQIDIVISASFGMILSSGNENIEVKTSVPIAQTIIVGEVPEGFMNMNN